MRGPFHEWRTKIPSPRYDSDDSGIAESPNSMTSLMTTKPNTDLEECLNFDRQLQISKQCNRSFSKQTSDDTSYQPSYMVGHLLIGMSMKDVRTQEVEVCSLWTFFADKGDFFRCGLQNSRIFVAKLI